MTFIAMLIAAIVIIIVAAVAIANFIMLPIFLTLGIVKRKSRKTSGIVFLILAAVNVAVLCCLAFSIFGPKRVEIKTPNDTEKVWSTTIKKLDEAIDTSDINAFEALLDKYPELIFYVDDDAFSPLENAVFSGDTEMVNCALSHGAEFDSGPAFERLIADYSLELYFHWLNYDSGDTGSEEILNMTELMLKNGAAVYFNADCRTSNAVQSAFYWIYKDKIISDGDIRLIELLNSYGCSYNHTYNEEETTEKIYIEVMDEYDVVKDENYYELLSILQSED